MEMKNNVEDEESPANMMIYIHLFACSWWRGFQPLILSIPVRPWLLSVQLQGIIQYSKGPYPKFA